MKKKTSLKWGLKRAGAGAGAALTLFLTACGFNVDGKNNDDHNHEFEQKPGVESTIQTPEKDDQAHLSDGTIVEWTPNVSEEDLESKLPVIPDFEETTKTENTSISKAGNDSKLTNTEIKTDIDDQDTVDEEVKENVEPSQVATAWALLNDTYEYRTLPDGSIETRPHQSYKIVKSDAEHEYIRCETCGHEATREHELDAEKKNADGSITQNCKNEGCQYVNIIKKPINQNTPSSGGNYGTGGSHGGNGGSGITTPDHVTHNYVVQSWNDSYETLKCSTCGNIKTQGHAYDNGTLNEDGSTTYRCTHAGCEYAYTKTVKPVGHNHTLGNKKTEIEYLENGQHREVITTTCTAKDCDKSEGWFKVSYGEPENCNYGEPEHVGYSPISGDKSNHYHDKKKTCLDCKHVHTFSDIESHGSWTTTENNDGTTHYECNECGFSYDSEKAPHVCTEFGQEMTRKPVDNGDGTHSIVHYHVCQECGTEVELPDKLETVDHNIETTSNEIEKASECKNCDYRNVLCTHTLTKVDYEKTDTYCPYTETVCSNCNTVISDTKKEHIYDRPVNVGRFEVEAACSCGDITTIDIEEWEAEHGPITTQANNIGLPVTSPANLVQVEVAAVIPDAEAEEVELSEEQTPEGQEPAEGQIPEGQEPAEGQTPEDQEPTEGQTPEDQEPTEGQTPEDQEPTEGQTPEDQEPTEGQTPEDQEPAEGQTPEDQEPTEGQIPEGQEPAEGQTSEDQELVEEKSDVDYEYTTSEGKIKTFSLQQKNNHNHY